MTDELKSCPFSDALRTLEQHWYTDEELSRWLNTPHPQFDGLSAIQMLAAGRLQREIGWQEIETAPKDGTDILVCETHNLPGGELETMQWVDCYHENGWVRWADRIDIPFTPSHWMPLPEPPAV